MITEYHFDKINIGGSLECLLHSFINNEQVLLIKPLYPFELEEMPYHTNLKFLGYDNNRIIRKSEMWDRLSFLLSMSGQIIFPNIIKSFRTDKNRFILVTEFNKRVCITTDETNVWEEPIEDYVNVYDWFHVRSGNNHSLTKIKDKRHDFIHTIHFYQANRVGTNGITKDICAESRLLTQEVTEPDYSEGIARLKTIKMMKDKGIKGQSNGYSKSGKTNHYAIKIEHTHREIIHDYLPLRTIEEILTDKREEGKAWELAKNLFRHKQISILKEKIKLPKRL